MINKVKELVSQAAIYVPDDCEGMRVDTWDEEEGCFWATGEESGESYCISFEDVNLEADIFYKLVAMN